MILTSSLSSFTAWAILRPDTKYFIGETAVNTIASGNRFAITKEMAGPYNSGAAKTGLKQWTQLRFEIEAVTADTYIGIVDIVSLGRICVDNVVVTRK